jgi:hypothetical protein
MKLEYRSYKFAFNSSKRRETFNPDGTIRQQAGCFSYLSKKVRPGEGINCVHVSTGALPTADWTWDGTRHRIRVSDRLAETMLGEEGSEILPLHVPLAKAALTHEVCHGLYTDRNFSETHRLCDANKIPFRLLNLFEDCRIEQRYVMERGAKFKFGWRKLLECAHQKKVESPEHLLLQFKNREAFAIMRSPAASAAMRGFVEWTGNPTIRFRGLEWKVPNLVWEFYHRSVLAASTHDLIPIIVDWLEAFPYSPASLPPILIKAVPGSIGGILDPANPDSGLGGDSDTRTHDPDSKEPAPPPGTPMRVTVSDDRIFPGDVEVSFDRRFGGLVSLSRFTM